MRDKYTKSELSKAIAYFNSLNIRDHYLTLVNITSSYYDIEINGIHIEGIRFDENLLEITTPNNRKIRLKIVDDMEIEFRGVN